MKSEASHRLHKLAVLRNLLCKSLGEGGTRFQIVHSASVVGFLISRSLFLDDPTKFLDVCFEYFRCTRRDLFEYLVSGAGQTFLIRP